MPNTPTASFLLVSAIAILAGCGGASPKHETPKETWDPAVTVKVSSKANMEEVSHALALHGAARGEPWVAVLIGEPDPAHPLAPVRIAWDDGAINAWGMTEAQSTFYLREDPRAHNQAMLFWQKSGFVMVHGSDTSESAPFVPEEMAVVNQQMNGHTREGAFHFISDRFGTAGEVLPALERVLIAANFVMIPVE